MTTQLPLGPSINAPFIRSVHTHYVTTTQKIVRKVRLTGLQLKEQGVASLERHRWVDKARSIAEWRCRHQDSVTTDDIHRVMGTMSPQFQNPPHLNCWGAIFHDKRFRATGRVRSTRPEAHGRWIEVWRLA